MAGGRHETRHRAHRTRTVRRSRLFFVAPAVIISFLSANLLWEIARANVGQPSLADWPFRFSTLNLSSTATAWTVFVALFMGRLQWARSLRPHTGFAIEDRDASFSSSSNEWHVWFYNAGPGGAIVSSMRYLIEFRDQSDPAGEWVSLQTANHLMKAEGFVDGEDYFIRQHAGPLPVVSEYKKGRDIAWFKLKALAQLLTFDVRISFEDTLGDAYVTDLQVINHLPSVTLKAIARYKGTSS